jgi:glycosyltransferase involved in cell wall biosynthesis
MTMRILITHELFPPDVVGGGEKLVLKLAKHMIARGHSVKIVTSGDPKIKSHEGVETIRIPANRYLMNLLALPEILKHAQDADIIQTSSGNMALPSYIAAKLLNKPICCWVHHIFGKYWRDIRGPIAGRFFEIGEQFILTRKFDSYVFQNASSKRIGTKIGISAQKIRMITPGIDYKKFAMKRKVKRGRNVLFVGNFSMDEATIKTKGVKYLIEAAEILPDIEFVLVGNFKEKIEYPENVKILGSVSSRKLVELYNKAGVVVCNSLNEGFSLVLLEAMASGCAIVSTVDIGQIGKKVRPKDPELLARAIKSYIDNPKVARADGKKNERLSKKYTWNSFYRAFGNLFKSLCF